MFSGLSTVSFSAGAAQLSWSDAVGETTKYRVFYQAGSTLNFSTATFADVTAPATTYSISGLPDNQYWSFAVRAVDSRNQSDSNTTTRQALAGDLIPPAFNGLVSLVAVSGSETQLKLIFNKSTDTDLSYYKLRYRVTGTTPWNDDSATIAPSASATIEATLSGLLPTTSYDVFIRAFDTSGNPSVNTSYMTRSTNDATPPQFSGVSSVASKPNDASKARVTWNTASDAGGIKEYRVYYSTQSLIGKTLVRTATYPLTVGGQTINMSLAVTSGTTADIAGLNENTLYYFVVHAIDNSDNEDSNAAQQSFTMPFFTPPAAPTGLSFSGANPSSDRSPFITGTSIAGYTVKLYVDSVYNNSLNISSSGVFSMQFVPQLPNTTGNYVVSASHVNPSGIEGPATTVGTYQLQVSAPVATLTGGPANSGSSAATALAITVGGTNVTHYKYSLMMNQATACSGAIYGSWIVVSTTITDSTGADGTKRLCVVGKNAAAIEQDVASATQIDWTKDSAAPAAPTISISNPITSSTSITYSPLISVSLGTVTGVAAYCVKSGATEPTVNGSDGCWSASKPTSVTLPTPTVRTATTYNVYAWAKSASGMITTTPNSASISYLNPCDSGDLSGVGSTCNITGTWTLTSGGVTVGAQGSLNVATGGVISGAAGDSSSFTLSGDFSISNAGTVSANISITAANVSVLGTGVLKADGLGHMGTINAAGAGTAGGLTGAFQGGGGGHGGTGARESSEVAYCRTNYLPGGTTYGSATSPTTFGSAGGGSATVAGRAGGGAIKIVASGVVTVSGTISSNGLGNAGVGAIGTGAGGSIWINANSFSGTGSIGAKGGDQSSGSNANVGMGGGGRVSFASSNPFLGTVSVDGGSPVVNGGTTNGCGLNGDPGSFYTAYSNICNSGTLSATCTISSSFMLGDGYAITGTGNLVLDSGANIRPVRASRTLSINISGDLTLNSGAYLKGNFTNLQAANISVNSGAVLSATGYGFEAVGANSELQATASGGTSWFTSLTQLSSAGGGHGGYGGHTSNYGGHGTTNHYFREGGGTYGSRTAPVTWGSSGGNCFSSGVTGCRGAAGGGAIKIVTAGTLTIDGTIESNGVAGTTFGSSYSSGGGAGGSLWISAGSVAGTGSIKAEGGDGTSISTFASGGGGGGRISLSASNVFSGSLSVLGGSLSDGFPRVGRVGTFYFSNTSQYCSSGSTSTTCNISRAWRIENSETFSANNVVILNGGLIETNRAETAVMTLSGTLTINSGGAIKANLVSLTATDVTIASGGLLSANGLGSAGANITGSSNSGGGSGGGAGGSVGAGGGGHGGAGGAGGNGAAGVSHGSSTNPISYGGGGGSSAYSGGGDGGGRIQIVVSGTFTVNGTLSSNGTDAYILSTQNGGGGGAGGTINVTTSTFAGSGTITVLGGTGSTLSGVNGGSGGGGGGRIAITRTSSTFSGSTSAAGGNCNGGCAAAPLSPGNVGAAGTVVLQ